MPEKRISRYEDQSRARDLLREARDRLLDRDDEIEYAAPLPKPRLSCCRGPGPLCEGHIDPGVWPLDPEWKKKKAAERI